MPNEISGVLEEFWAEIKTILNDDREGMDVHRLEALLKTHSRRIIVELGKSNIHALPPALVENIFTHALPKGIDPLISSLLGFLKIDAANDHLYLDPLGKVKKSTRKLRQILLSIANQEAGATNLVWLQYAIYLESVTHWQEVIGCASKRIRTKLALSDTYRALQAELEPKPEETNKAATHWPRYLKEIKHRKDQLSILRNELNHSENISEIFFTLTMPQWNRLMLFNPETRAYWQKLWDTQGKNTESGLMPYLKAIPLLHWGRTLAAHTLNFVGLPKAAHALKTDKQYVLELIDQRLTAYQETESSCETLFAIERAEAQFVTKEPVIEAQIKQLDALEVHLNSVIAQLDTYQNNHHTLDGNHASWLLRFKAWLGFRNSILELESSHNLAASKSLSVTKVFNSTLNVLKAVQKAKVIEPAKWTAPPFEFIRLYAEHFHQTLHTESEHLDTSFHTHNDRFRHQWYFWHRKTVLVELFRNFTAHSPLKPS